MASAARNKGLARFAWLLLVLPGLAQLLLLCSAMFRRIGYPYDLEWMEGGLLTHAQRISDGLGIYGEPSADFIPFLYTPLYPGVMAMFDDLFGISYAVGRTISVLATLGLCCLLVALVRRESRSSTAELAWIGGACSVGFFSATYPWVEAWYDLVRADSLFMLMVVGGLYGLRAWAKVPGRGGIAKIACASALLGLAFFAKQTGVLFVATGGFMILVLNWRRVPIYVAVTGLLGLGLTWLLNKVTHGWFWVYIYKTHQHHDFNMDRFYKSFHNILWHFPIMTAVIALTMVLILATFLRCRRLPEPALGMVLWFPVFVVAIFVGALGWGTEFAHYNAYIPAMVFGALCAGLALPAIASCLACLVAGRDDWIGRHGPMGVGFAVAAILGTQLLFAWWNPTTFVPTQADRQAGHELIQTLEEIEGEILIPYHPWYAHLAGKKTQVHLMGLRDMTTGKVWPIRGLTESINEQRYAAIIMDNRPFGRELHLVKSRYRMHDHLPKTSSPHVYTGAGAVWNKSVATLIPRSIWVPNALEKLPEGARVLWDFEDGSLGDWQPAKGRKKRKNSAWGKRPVSRPLHKQGPVRRYGGRYYLTSFHGGDKSVGTLHSPSFTIDGTKITFRISGGNSIHLRAELIIEGVVLRTATGEDSERMQEIEWNVAAYQGKVAEIVLIDDDKGSWGHLNVDEFWMW